MTDCLVWLGIPGSSFAGSTGNDGTGDGGVCLKCILRLWDKQKITA